MSRVMHLTGWSAMAWLAGAVALSAQVEGSNNFAARPALTLNASGTATGVGSNELATAEVGEPDHMAWPAAQSLWWRWTAPATGVAQFDTVGSSFITRLVVYTGPILSSLQQVAGNVTDSGAANFESVVRFVAVTGVTYSIVVDGYSDEVGTETGSIVLNLAQPVVDQPPANDNFASPQSLGNAMSATATGNTSNASVEAQEPDSETTFYPTGPGRSVWFTWMAPSSDYFTVQVDGEAGNSEPTVGVYQGNTLATLTTIDKGELLAFEPGDSTPALATATFLATAGQTYRIVAAAKSFNAIHGAFDIVLKPAQRPVNDDFAAAVDLGSGTTAAAQGSLLESTRQGGEPNHFSALGYTPSYSSSSVWWKWTAPTTGLFTVDTRGSDGDTIVAVYRAMASPPAFGNLQLVAVGDDINFDDGFYSSVVTFNATASGIYFFAVSGYALSSAVHFHLAAGPPRTPFAAWLLDFPALTGADAAKDADPDFDGLPNLVELMLGTDPTKSSWSDPVDRPWLPTASTAGTDFFLDSGYSSENINGLSDGVSVGGAAIIVTAQMSSDLQTWTSVPADQVEFGTLNASASVPLSSAGAQFLRFRIVDSNP
jgi:hypothetical protein